MPENLHEFALASAKAAAKGKRTDVARKVDLHSVVREKLRSALVKGDSREGAAE